MTGDRRPVARSFAVLLVVAVLLRLVCVLLSDRMVADVLRYHRIASHVLDVSWNPYEAPRLYPYPPVWILFEVAAEWLSRGIAGAFPILVKLPVVAADTGIVWLLARVGLSQGATRRSLAAAWAYALHPVALLVVGFHGQFDSLAVLAVLAAVVLRDAGRRDASALALALGIATKSYPVLLLPFFLMRDTGWRQAARFLALATVPVAMLLLPFALANAPALHRELFAYGGIADFGWIGLLRSFSWLRTGGLPRSEAVHWSVAVGVGKTLFLAVWCGIVALVFRRRDAALVDACLAVLLGFLALYGAVSAQYLLWVIPLGLLCRDRHSVSFGVSATVALLGFYPFLAPGVLFVSAPGSAPSPVFGVVWAVGLVLLLGATLAWLGATLRRLWSRSPS